MLRNSRVGDFDGDGSGKGRIIAGAQYPVPVGIIHADQAPEFLLFHEYHREIAQGFDSVISIRATVRYRSDPFAIVRILHAETYAPVI